jgi:thymidylate synthase
MNIFEGDTADAAWQIAAQRFRDVEAAQKHLGRGGQTDELLHAIFAIHDPRQRWVVSRHPGLNPAFAIVEVIWIINGRNESAIINHWNPAYANFAGKGESYHGAYGFRLRKHFGIDQLTQAYDTLSNIPATRQVVLQIWDSVADLPKDKGKPNAEDIPCNINSLLKLRNGKLEWFQILRSNDLFRGVPYNFVQFTCLQEIVAGWLNVELGSYYHLSDSLHVYEDTFDQIRTSEPLEVKPNTDSLCLPKTDSEQVFSEMYRRLETMIDPDISEAQFRKASEFGSAPQAYQNLLAVVAADSARRKFDIDLARELMASCTNPVLVQLWERWLDSRSTK